MLKPKKQKIVAKNLRKKDLKIFIVTQLNFGQHNPDNNKLKI